VLLVAFVTLSLVATALFRLYSGASATRRRPTTTVALYSSPRARSRRPQRQPLAEDQQRNGDDGRIAWTTKVAVYTPPDVPPDLDRASETLPTRLYRITTE
jgi:hypothetical protein